MEHDGTLSLDSAVYIEHVVRRHTVLDTYIDYYYYLSAIFRQKLF